MLLKLKAEAVEDDYIAVMSCAITMLALMVAVITLCVTMLSEIGMPARWVLFLIYSVLLVYYFVTIKNKMRYFKNVNKWRQYILVCIDEMVNKQNKKKKKIKINHKISFFMFNLTCNWWDMFFCICNICNTRSAKGYKRIN